LFEAEKMSLDAAVDLSFNVLEKLSVPAVDAGVEVIKQVVEAAMDTNKFGFLLKYVFRRVVLGSRKMEGHFPVLEAVV
jgi:hypothetical protein